MSYDGHLGFGLLADFDAVPDLETMVDDLGWAIDSLSRAAGVSTKRKRAKKPRASKASAAATSSNGAVGNSAHARSSEVRTRAAE
jgi:hypothetical protein